MAEKVFRIRETGLQFTIGHVCDAQWPDARYCIVKLKELGKFRVLFPGVESSGDIDSLRGEIEASLDTAIRRAEVIGLTTKRGFRAYIWVLACYTHKHLNGPKPTKKTYDLGYSRRRWVATIRFRCPVCGEPWDPPHHLRTESLLIEKFAGWLLEHMGESYHQKKTTRHVAHILFMMKDTEEVEAVYEELPRDHEGKRVLRPKLVTRRKR